MTRHPKFLPKFFDLRTFEKLEALDAKVPPNALEIPERQAPSLERSNSGKLERFLAREARLKTEDKFETMVDGVSQFANENGPKLKPPMSKDRVKIIMEDLGRFKRHLTEENHFGPHNEIMFDHGKHHFREFHDLLKSEEIPLHRRMDAVAAMAPSLPMCSGGVITAIEAGVVDLRYGTCGLAGAVQLKKGALVQAAIDEFISKNHAYQDGNHVHFVNAYYNPIAQDFGLPVRLDPFETIAQNEVSAEKLAGCKQHVLQALQPMTIAMALAETYLQKIQDAVSQAKAKANPDPSRAEDPQTTLFRVIKELQHSVLDREFGTVPQECFLTEAPEEQCRPYEFDVARKPTLITKHFVEQLKEAKLIDYNNTIELSKAGAGGGELKIKILGELMWMEEDNHCTEISLTNLLEVSPSDMITSLNNQNIPRYAHAAILFSVAQRVLTETTLAPQAVFAAWADDFAAAYKESLPSVLQGMHPMIVMSAEAGNVTMLDALLSQGANCDARGTKHGYTALMAAVRSGKVEVLDRLIDAGANVDITDFLGRSAILEAVQFKNSGALQRLVSAGANLNGVTVDGHIATGSAAMMGDVIALQCLINGGADLELADPNGFTPLAIAVFCNHPDIVDCLIKTRVNLEARTTEGNTALSIAVLGGHTALAATLIKNKADVNCRNIYGETPAMMAAVSGNLEVLHLLIAAQANMEMRDTGGRNAMIMAAKCGNTAALACLIGEGVNVNAVDNEKTSSLIAAASGGHVEILRQLVAANADIDAKDKSSFTALMRAVAAEQKDAVDFLIESHADLDHRCVQGHSAFIHAAANGNVGILKSLAEAGADVNTAEIHTRTNALMIAAENNNLDALEYLAGAHGKLNAQNEYGLTAAMFAILGNSVDTMKWLIENNADLDIGNRMGRVPFTFAAEMGRIDILKLLIEAGADVDAIEPNTQMNGVMIAAQKNKLEALKYLLDVGGTINARMSNGQTAAMLAANQGNVEVLQWLVTAGAALDDRCNAGMTCVHLAVRKDRTATLSLLIESGANLDIRDSAGASPLMHAISCHNPAAVKTLIEAGVDVNLINNDGFNYAGLVREQDVEIKQALTPAGVKPGKWAWFKRAMR